MDFVLPIPLIVEGGPMGVIDILSLVMLAALWLLVLYVIIKLKMINLFKLIILWLKIKSTWHMLMTSDIA